MAAKLKDLTGKRFGRLVALERVGKSHGVIWKCLCDCGNITFVVKSCLERSTKSCGCLRSEYRREMFLKHGMDGTPEYTTWIAMRGRCSNPAYKSYKNYGGRGIKVCERWISSFENFFLDMGKRPEGYSIERIDNNGNYEPANCKWIPINEQQANRRNARRILWNGEYHSARFVAQSVGINPTTFYNRLDYGWSIEKAVVPPTRI